MYKKLRCIRGVDLEEELIFVIHKESLIDLVYQLFNKLYLNLFKFYEVAFSSVSQQSIRIGFCNTICLNTVSYKFTSRKSNNIKYE